MSFSQFLDVAGINVPPNPTVAGRTRPWPAARILAPLCAALLAAGLTTATAWAKEAPPPPKEAPYEKGTPPKTDTPKTDTPKTDTPPTDTPGAPAPAPPAPVAAAPVAAPPAAAPPAPAVPVAAAPPPSEAQAPRTRLAVVKSGPLRMRAGGVARFRIRVTNIGDAPAVGVRVVDVLRGGLTLAGPGTARLVDGRPTWRIARLAPGRSRVVTIAVRLDRGSRGGRCNRVRVRAGNAPAARARACFRITARVPVPTRPAVTG